MSEFTWGQVDDLAVFAGATKWWSHETSSQPSESGWLFEQVKPAWPVIMRKDWRPDSNPLHTDLVLRALIQRLQRSPEACCKAALEVIKRGNEYGCLPSGLNNQRRT